MNDTIIVRYSEIFLKSDFVRKRLQKKLVENIQSGLNKNRIKAKITRERGRIFIENPSKDCLNLLKHVFGIVSFSIALKMDLNELEGFIKMEGKELINEGSFAVRVQRSGEHDFTSQELAARLGEIIIEETNKKVDLTKPKNELYVEVRGEEAYVFTEKIDGPGGMPIGSQGKVNCFIDSNESLVSCWLMMKRGCIPCVYYTTPETIKSLEKWCYGIKIEKNLVKNLSEVKNDLPLVIGITLSKGGLKEVKKLQKRFKTVLTPSIAFKEEEIDKYLEKINK
jgi:thiamine biosynthesis protein ThiI